MVEPEHLVQAVLTGLPASHRQLLLCWLQTAAHLSASARLQGQVQEGGEGAAQRWQGWEQGWELAQALAWTRRVR